MNPLIKDDARFNVSLNSQGLLPCFALLCLLLWRKIPKLPSKCVTISEIHLRRFGSKASRPESSEIVKRLWMVILAYMYDHFVLFYVRKSVAKDMENLVLHHCSLTSVQLCFNSSYSPLGVIHIISVWMAWNSTTRMVTECVWQRTTSPRIRTVLMCWKESQMTSGLQTNWSMVLMIVMTEGTCGWLPSYLEW